MTANLRHSDECTGPSHCAPGRSRTRRRFGPNHTLSQRMPPPPTLPTVEPSTNTRTHMIDCFICHDHQPRLHSPSAVRSAVKPPVQQGTLARSQRACAWPRRPTTGKGPPAGRRTLPRLRLRGVTSLTILLIAGGQPYRRRCSCRLPCSSIRQRLRSEPT